MNKAIFLDRDGTINIDDGYISAADDFYFLPKAFEGLKSMKSSGYLLIVITNQSGIGRDYYTIEDYQQVMQKMDTELEKQGIILDDVFYCPHSPESNCECRKPGTKMLETAISKWDIDTSKSYFIGDKHSDMKAGNALDIKTILIAEEEKSFDQNFTAKDLVESYNYIIKDI